MFRVREPPVTCLLLLVLLLLQDVLPEEPECRSGRDCSGRVDYRAQSLRREGSSRGRTLLHGSGCGRRSGRGHGCIPCGQPAERAHQRVCKPARQLQQGCAGQHGRLPKRSSRRSRGCCCGRCRRCRAADGRRRAPWRRRSVEPPLAQLHLGHRCRQGEAAAAKGCVELHQHLCGVPPVVVCANAVKLLGAAKLGGAVGEEAKRLGTAWGFWEVGNGEVGAGLGAAHQQAAAAG
jgi:hypothetical protein